jgi:hypothetical protein
MDDAAGQADGSHGRDTTACHGSFHDGLWLKDESIFRPPHL